jgi:hypothetical protein
LRFSQRHSYLLCCDHLSSFYAPHLTLRSYVETSPPGRMPKRPAVAVQKCRVDPVDPTEMVKEMLKISALSRSCDSGLPQHSETNYHVFWPINQSLVALKQQRNTFRKSRTRSNDKDCRVNPRNSFRRAHYSTKVVLICCHMTGGQNYLLPAMDMAKMGGPLSVVKVCTSMLGAKIRYRQVGGPLSVVNVFAQMFSPLPTTLVFR